MTGTTPTQSAVRLETGAVELHLSNRIDSPGEYRLNPTINRIYGRAQVSATFRTLSTLGRIGTLVAIITIGIERL